MPPMDWRSLRLSGFMMLSCVGCGGGTETPSPADPAPPSPVEAAAVAAPVEEPAEPQPEPVEPTHDVQIVIVHEEELLRSELRVLNVVKERLRLRGFDMGMRPATDDEAEYFGARFRPGTTDEGELPASLEGATRVIALHVPPPRELNNGALASRGVDGVLVVRLPSQAPILRIDVDPRSAWRATEGQLAELLLTVLRAEARP